MQDRDIPPGCQGDYTFVAFTRGGFGCLVLPKGEDVERTVQALGPKTQVVSIIRGVSAEAADILQAHYWKLPVQGNRGLLRQLLTAEDN